MSKTALFVRHRAKPGYRDDVRRVWEKYVRPRAAANAAHEAYYFCFDNNDPDVIYVFQLYSDPDAMTAFLAGAWYPEYLAEVSPLVAEPPQLTPAALIWAKGGESRREGA
jgi:quinol monooxygenase YgiN